MAIEKYLIAEWITGWFSEAEAWPLGGFLMHGHWVGFWGMATGWVSEACRLPLFGCTKEVLCLGCIFWPKSFQPERIIICKKSSFSIENFKKIEIEKVTDLLTLLFDKLFSVRCQQTVFYFLMNFKFKILYFCPKIVKNDQYLWVIREPVKKKNVKNSTFPLWPKVWKIFKKQKTKKSLKNL